MHVFLFLSELCFVTTNDLNKTITNNDTIDHDLITHVLQENNNTCMLNSTYCTSRAHNDILPRVQSSLVHIFSVLMNTEWLL